MPQRRWIRGDYCRSMPEARQIGGCHGAAAAAPPDRGAVAAVVALLDWGIAAVVLPDRGPVVTVLLDRGATNAVTLDRGTAVAALLDRGVVTPLDRGIVVVVVPLEVRC